MPVDFYRKKCYNYKIYKISPSFPKDAAVSEEI